MKKAFQYCTKIENIVIVITFVIMVCAVFIQVVNRNIFKVPFTGFEEISKYSMVYMVLLGTELGLRDGTQISVTGIVDKLRGLIKSIVVIVAKLIIVIFSAVMCYEAVGMVEQHIITGQTSPGLQMPMTVPYAALVISFGIITLVQTISTFNMITNLVKYKDIEGNKED